MTAYTSVSTPHKMDVFRKIMAWHIIITDAARGKWYQNRWPFKKDYLYIDLYAGPGEYIGDPYYTGDGSPLIAMQQLDVARMPYHAVLFNLDSGECETLQESLNGSQATIINSDNQNATNHLQCFNNQFGLAYFDPNDVHFDHELGLAISQCLPKVDLLFYLSGRYEKLTKNSPNTPAGEGHSIIEKMGMFNKETWLVHSLHSKDQYTFLLGTNAKPGGWKREGWFLVDSAPGMSTLTRLNWTPGEIASGQAWQLGFDLDEEE